LLFTVLVEILSLRLRGTLVLVDVSVGRDSDRALVNARLADGCLDFDNRHVVGGLGPGNVVVVVDLSELVEVELLLLSLDARSYLKLIQITLGDDLDVVDAAKVAIALFSRDKLLGVTELVLLLGVWIALDLKLSTVAI